MPAELIDTHAHLDDQQFGSDLPAVLDRARAAGVAHVIAIATTADSSETCANLAQQHAAVSATVGIQPNHVAQAEPGDWDTVVRLAESPQVVALGETGLDRHWDYTPFAQQEDYFARHLALARRWRRPVVIHCREAEDDVLRMLRQEYDRHGPIRGVMHSFTGDAASAAACLAMGLHISFAGMVTYKSAGALREVAVGIPADRLILETDSPYLAPVPVRGRRNEPAYLVHTAALVAAVRQVDVAALGDQTTLNARALFGLQA